MVNAIGNLAWNGAQGVFNGMRGVARRVNEFGNAHPLIYLTIVSVAYAALRYHLDLASSDSSSNMSAPLTDKLKAAMERQIALYKLDKLDGILVMNCSAKFLEGVTEKYYFYVNSTHDYTGEGIFRGSSEVDLGKLGIQNVEGTEKKMRTTRFLGTARISCHWQDDGSLDQTTKIKMYNAMGLMNNMFLHTTRAFIKHQVPGQDGELVILIDGEVIEKSFLGGFKSVELVRETLEQVKGAENNPPMNLSSTQALILTKPMNHSA